MKLNKEFFFSKDQYLHMERYVNDGSPSGFTDVHKTSNRTNPFTGEDKFRLLEFDVSDVDNTYIGDKNELLERAVNYAHPDSIASEVLIKSSRTIVDSELIVSPTSGGRTMLLRSHDCSGYLKLTYDVSRIGRVDRQLTLNHCLSSIEVSNVLKRCIDDNIFPSFLAIQLEPAAKVSKLEYEDFIYEWGVIYREEKPYPYREEKLQLIPGFSLFSKDKKALKDDILINQMIELSGADPEKYLINLLYMIVDCYWSIVVNCAFHIECHGQNCYFEVDENYNILRMVIKDMDSVDKDIPLAKTLCIKSDWESHPYMCFDESIYYYPIRSSYMYDFKLGEYLLTPIINVVSKKYDLDSNIIEKRIREHVNQRYLCKLPRDYFTEDGCWYNCSNTERKPGARREYFAHENPKYR